MSGAIPAGAPGFDCVSLLVNASNAVAIALYRRIGFAVLDDALWMARMDEAFQRHGVRRVVMRAHLP